MRMQASGHNLRAQRDSLPRSERGVFGVRRSTGSSGERARLTRVSERKGSEGKTELGSHGTHRPQLRAQRDSLPRSERGVWGVRRSTPQLNEGQ